MVKAEIFRYNPNIDQEPRFQTFSLPLQVGETVLGLLQYIRTKIDPSLSFKAYCMNEHCGECAVMLNGRPVLACRQTITDNSVVIKPLPRFKVVKDLVVDIEGPAKRIWSCLPPLIGSTRNLEILPENDQDIFFIAGRCNGCFICQSTCHLYKEEQEVIAGPAIYIIMAQYLLRAAAKEEINVFLSQAVKNGLLKCNLCGKCTKICPQGVNPVNVISAMRNLLADNTLA